MNAKGKAIVSTIVAVAMTILSLASEESYAGKKYNPPNLYPVAIAEVYPNPAVINEANEARVNLDPNKSYDQDFKGYLTKYEWDIDWDGVEENFSKDYSTDDASVTVHTYNNAVAGTTYLIGLKVTDNGRPTPRARTDIDGVEVTLVSNLYHVATTGDDDNNGLSWPYAFRTVQRALSVAESYSEIWVAEGTYYPDECNEVDTNDREASFVLVSDVETYGGFAGTERMRSQRNPKDNETILSGEIQQQDPPYINDNSYHVVTGADAAVLDGFTISGGFANPFPTGISGGGGIFCLDSSPTISNCRIQYNGSGYYSGGIYCEGGSPKIQKCIISDNFGQQGGGITCINVAAGTHISECIIGDNEGSFGAGIYNESGDLTVTDCMLVGNWAAGGGPSNGGGMCNNSGATANLTNCVFSMNTATYCGGGMDNGYGTATLTNCTFSNNEADYAGGGIYNYSGDATLRNCIFWGNEDTGGVDYSAQIHGGTVDIAYSCIKGITFGTGNINVNPLFVDADNPAGADGILCTRDDGLQLETDSDCVDAGLNGAINDLTDTDIIGYTRIVDGDGDGSADVDMGAYEMPMILYVDKDADPNEADGKSWETAFVYLQDALETKTIEDAREVWVAEGTYYPDQTSSDPNGSSMREVPFLLAKNAGVYGGFNATETRREQRNWKAYETILSGDVNEPNNPADNSYCVVRAVSGAILDGFTITCGNADGLEADGYTYGSGINCSKVPAEIRNCVIKGNAAGYGAGMYCEGQSCSPEVTDCFFVNNSAINGAAIADMNGADPAFINCVFAENNAQTAGGGIYSEDSFGKITNCTLTANNSDANGGGMYNSSSAPTVINSIVWGNDAGISGPEVYNNLSNPHFSYSDINGCGGSGEETWNLGFGVDDGNNIDEDPLFVMSGGPIAYWTMDDNASNPFVKNFEQAPTNLIVDGKFTSSTQDPWFWGSSWYIHGYYDQAWYDQIDSDDTEQMRTLYQDIGAIEGHDYRFCYGLKHVDGSFMGVYVTIGGTIWGHSYHEANLELKIAQLTCGSADSLVKIIGFGMSGDAEYQIDDFYCFLSEDFPGAGIFYNLGTSAGYNTSAHSVGGRIGNALTFDGADDYVDCGIDSSLDITDKLSISTWVKFDNLPTIAANIVSKSGAYRIGYDPTFDKWYFEIYDSTGSKRAYSTDTVSGNYSSGVWYNFVGVMDGTQSTLYINANQHESEYPSEIVSKLTTPVRIGQKIDGAIDDIMIFDRALGFDEIQQIYENGLIGESTPFSTSVAGEDGIFGTEDDGLQLSQDGPCIDAGTNEPIGGLPATDIVGNPRSLDGDGNGSVITDMGPYEHEYQNQPPQVDAGADQQITMPDSDVELVGMVIDDGLLNPPGVVEITWECISVPAGTIEEVTIDNPSEEITTARGLVYIGSYTFKLTAYDGEFTISDTMDVIVDAAPIVVKAGYRQTIELPQQQATLFGASVTGGIPGQTQATWEVVGWPEGADSDDVDFAMCDDGVACSPEDVVTTVDFPNIDGPYILRLSAWDGESNDHNEVVIELVKGDDSENERPYVNAGTYTEDVLVGAELQLDGTVIDDGLPENYLIHEWSQHSCEPPGGEVNFEDPCEVDTLAMFDTKGTYTLRLWASDGELENDHFATINVVDPLGTNYAPVVDAGKNQAINMVSGVATLDFSQIEPPEDRPSVTDDGLPVGSSVVIKWSLAKGPSLPTFTPPEANVELPTVTFDIDDTYTLKLWASDGELDANDLVKITVLPESGEPEVDAGENKLEVLPTDGTVDVTMSDASAEDKCMPMDNLTYSWTLLVGSSSGIDFNGQQTEEKPTFIFDEVGVYKLQFEATDTDCSVSASDTVYVTIKDAPVEKKSIYVISDTGTSMLQVYEHQYDEGSGLWSFVVQGTGLDIDTSGAVGLAMDEEERYMFVTFEGKNEIKLIDAKNMQVVDSLTAPGASNLAGIVFDQTKGKVYTVDRGTKYLYVYKWYPEVPELVLEGDPVELEGLIDASVGGAWGLALDEQYERLYVTSNETTVRYYNTDNWSHDPATDFVTVGGHQAVGITIDGDNRWLYTGNIMGTDATLIKTHLDTKSQLVSVDIRNIPGDVGGTSVDDILGLSVDQETSYIYATIGNKEDYTNPSERLVAFEPDLDMLCATGDIGNPADVVAGATVCYKPPLSPTTFVKIAVRENCTCGTSPCECLVSPIADETEDEITYTISFTNGLQDIVGAYIVDRLPRELDFVSATENASFAYVYNPYLHTVTWHLGTVDNGVSLPDFQVTGRVNLYAKPGGSIVNRCEIETDHEYLAAAPVETSVECWSQNEIIYVDKNTAGFANGTSWQDAYRDLQHALNHARTCSGIKEIWVAGGPEEDPEVTYRPGTDVLDSFVLVDGIGLYGGFAGDEINRSERDFETNKTYLAGSSGPYAPRCEKVVYCSSDGSVCNPGVLDGFVITGGDCGIYFNFDYTQCSESNVTVRNCEIIDNTEWGIEFDGTYGYMPGTITITGNKISGNGNAAGNGGIFFAYNYYSYSGSSYIRITNNEIINNNEIGIDCYYVDYADTFDITNNKILYNNKYGIWVDNGKAKINNNLISHNGDTGIYIATTSNSVIRNSTILNNGVYGIHEASYAPNVSNCIIWGNGNNASNENLKGNFEYSDYYLGYVSTVNYCLVGGGYEPSDAIWVGNISDDPQFDTDGCHLTIGSPCIDTGFNDNTTVNTGQTNTIKVDQGKIGLYRDDNIIEIGNDGVPRIITEVDTESEYMVTFDPALGSSAAVGTEVFNLYMVSEFDDVTTDSGSTTTIVVGDARKYHQNDTIQINGSTNHRVTAVDLSNDVVTFEPAYSSSTNQGMPVHNWSIVSESDIDGDARVLGQYVDMGVDEMPSLLLDAGDDRYVIKDTEEPFVVSVTDINPSAPPQSTTYEWTFEGPGTPSFNPSATTKDVGITFPTLGRYELTITAYEDYGSGNVIAGSDTVTVYVYIGVEATATPEEISLPLNTINVTGSFTGGTPAVAEWYGYKWYEEDEEGLVSFNPQGPISPADPPDAVATFTDPGTYDLFLVARDDQGEVMGWDMVTVIVYPEGFPIVVEAGDDIEDAIVNQELQLDGWFDGPDTVEVVWYAEDAILGLEYDFTSSPFESESSVVFYIEGGYTMRFEAWYDSLLVGYDTMDITVRLPNQAPIVRAGSPKSGVIGEAIELFDAMAWDDYTSLDDLTFSWTILYPPSGCLSYFDNPALLNPTITFACDTTCDCEGTYTLQLEVNDNDTTGSLVGTGTVTVTIGTPPPPGETRFSAGEDKTVYWDGGDGPCGEWLYDSYVWPYDEQTMSMEWTVLTDPPPPGYVKFADPAGGSDLESIDILHPYVNFKNPADGTVATGDYTLQLQVTGAPEGTLTDTLTITVSSGSDTTKPVISSFYATIDGVPINNQIVEGLIEVVAVARDEKLDLNEFKLYLDYIDASSEPVNADIEIIRGTPDCPRELRLTCYIHTYGIPYDGWEHNFDLRVKDAAGNLSTASISFEIPEIKSEIELGARINAWHWDEEIDPAEWQIFNTVASDPLTIVDKGKIILAGAAYNPEGAPDIEYKIDLYQSEVNEYDVENWPLANSYHVKTLTDNPANDNFIPGAIGGDAVDALFDADNGSPSLQIFDLTGLENDNYQLLLTVRLNPDIGVYQYAKAGFILDSPLKVGNVKFSQEDMAIPVGGMPIRVIRSYDSLRKDKNGEFGNGWSYSFADMDIELNELRQDYEPVGGGSISLRDSSNFSRDVTLTLPNGERTTFALYLNANNYAYYQAPPGVTATLEAFDVTNPGQYQRYLVDKGLWYAQTCDGDYCNWHTIADFFEFPEFILTTEDGTKYLIERKQYDMTTFLYPVGGGSYEILNASPCGKPYLSKIILPNDDYIGFNVNQYSLKIDDITHYLGDDTDTKAIDVEYELGHITAIYAPTEVGTGTPTLKYVYENDNLIEVHKLIDKGSAPPETAEYEITTYSYDSDDYLTDIKDPRGLSPIRYYYENGLLCGIWDASGGYIDIEHDNPTYADAEVVTDRSGNLTVYTYDERGRVVSVIRDAGGTNEQTTSYTYEEYTRYEGTAEEHTYKNLYPDNPCVVTDHAGNNTYYQYDTAGRTTMTIDPELNITTNTYDEFGNVEITKQWKTDDATNPLFPGDYDEVSTTENSYDEDSLLQWTEVRQGSTVFSRTEYSYDTKNRLVEVTKIADPAAGPSASDILTSYSYDYTQSNSYDQPYSVSDPYHDGDTINYRYFKYNANGNQTESWYYSDTYTVSAITIYDDAGRVIETRRKVEQGTTPISEDILSHIVYNSIGKPDTVYDEHENATVYEYDELGNLVQTTTYASGSYETPLTVSQTLYDAEGRAIVTVGPYDAESSELPVGTETVYDALGRVAETRRWADVDIQMADVLNSNDEIVGKKSTGWLKGTQLSYTRTIYDIAGRVKHSITLDEDGYEQPTSYVYDLAGRQLVIIDPLGHDLDATDYDLVNGWYVIKQSWLDSPTYDYTYSTRTEYEGTRRKYVYPPGSYNSLGSGQYSVGSDTYDYRTEFTYDPLGRVTRTKYPETLIEGSSQYTYTHVEYDTLGRKAWESNVTDADGTIVSVPDSEIKDYEYDAAGRLTAVVLPTVPDPENSNTNTYVRTEYDYDTYGNLQFIRDKIRQFKRTSDPGFDPGTDINYSVARETEFTYNELHNKTSRTLPGGTSTEYWYYDSLGRLVKATDFKGQITGCEYDSQGRLWYKKFYIDETAYQAQSPAEVVEYAYDNLGRKDEVLVDAVSEQDFTYDAEGRITQIISPEGTVNYGYDSITGRKISTSTDDTGTGYSYDELGRLEVVKATMRGGVLVTVDDITTYGYNPVGSRVSLIQTVGTTDILTTTYTYNALNRLTDLVNGTLSNFHYTVAADGMRKTADENVDEDRYLYYTYDNLNRLTIEESEDDSTSPVYGYTSSYTYDLVGNRLTRSVEVTNTSGTTTLYTSYTYDDTDRLQTECQSLGGPCALIPWKDGKPIYAYASGGNISYQLPGQKGRIGQFRAFLLGLPSVWNRCLLLAILVLVPVVFFWPVITRFFRIFARAADDRSTLRISLYHRCMCVLLAYIMLISPVGLQSLAEADTAYSAISTLTWGENNTTIAYQYDDNGSVIEKRTYTTGGDPENYSELVTYEYNLQNRLKKVTVDDGSTPTVTDYTYNTDGIRVKADTDGTVTKFHIDPYNHTGYAQVIEEKDGLGDVTKSYTIGDDIISQTVGTDTQYLLYDGLGSTRQLVDINGDVIIDETYGKRSYSYDAYGVMLGTDDTAADNAGTSLLYAGEQYDSALGQYYLRARYYNPYNGSFNRTDPFAGNNQDPQSLHKYLYCHNNPINAIDPSGNMSITTGLVIALAIGAVLFGIGLAVRSKVMVGAGAAIFALSGMGLIASLYAAAGLLAAAALTAVMGLIAFVMDRLYDRIVNKAEEVIVEITKNYRFLNFVSRYTQDRNRRLPEAGFILYREASHGDPTQGEGGIDDFSTNSPFPEVRKGDKLQWFEYQFGVSRGDANFHLFTNDIEKTGEINPGNWVEERCFIEIVNDSFINRGEYGWVEVTGL